MTTLKNGSGKEVQTQIHLTVFWNRRNCRNQSFSHFQDKVRVQVQIWSNKFEKLAGTAHSFALSSIFISTPHLPFDVSWLASGDGKRRTRTPNDSGIADSLSRRRSTPAREMGEYSGREWRLPALSTAPDLWTSPFFLKSYEFRDGLPKRRTFSTSLFCRSTHR